MDESAGLPVVVIGAGPVGLAAAAELAERGVEPLVLEAVDSEDEVEDAPQSCRIVHETTALGSNDAPDEAAYFVESGSDSNDDAEEAPAYVVDEGSDTE